MSSFMPDVSALLMIEVLEQSEGRRTAWHELGRPVGSGAIPGAARSAESFLHERETPLPVVRLLATEAIADQAAAFI